MTNKRKAASNKRAKALPSCDALIRDAIEKIKRFRHQGKPTPHKPMLLMLMLGHYWNNGARMVLFRDVAIPLWGLLNKYSQGETYPTGRTLYPFVTLESDGGIWERTHPELDRLRYRKAFLAGMMGGFTEPVYQRIINDKAFLLELVALVHEKHLKHIDFKELLGQVNIPSLDPFKPGILGRSDSDQAGLHTLKGDCVVCGYKGSVSEKWSVGLRHAHVKWPVAGGPESTPDNVLLMCDLHKTLFDCGAFSIEPRRHSILISKSFKDHFIKQENTADPLPAESIKPEYVRWHNRIVYSPN